MRIMMLQVRRHAAWPDCALLFVWVPVFRGLLSQLFVLRTPLHPAPPPPHTTKCGRLPASNRPAARLLTHVHRHGFLRCLCAETSSGDDSDSSMTDDSTIVDGVTEQQQQEQQQLLLRNLQQKRVVGGTLLQWMQQNAPKIGLQITAQQAYQEGGLLNQVYVVTKWSDDLKPLVRVKNNRYKYTQPFIQLGEGGLACFNDAASPAFAA